MKKIVASVLFALALSASAYATPGVDFTTAGTSFSTSAWSLGYSFGVNAAATVTGLGVFDYAQDGLAVPQHVGLWDSSQTLLADVFVDDSDPLQGFWRFHAITPVNLTIGSTYYVASQGGEGYTFSTAGLTVDSRITFLQDAWHFNGNADASPLAFPDRTDSLGTGVGGGFFGGNVEFDTAPVPEPTTLALLGLGLVGLRARRRRTS